MPTVKMFKKYFSISEFPTPTPFILKKNHRCVKSADSTCYPNAPLLTRFWNLSLAINGCH